MCLHTNISKKGKQGPIPNSTVKMENERQRDGNVHEEMPKTLQNSGSMEAATRQRDLKGDAIWNSERKILYLGGEGLAEVFQNNE